MIKKSSEKWKRYVFEGGVLSRVHYINPFKRRAEYVKGDTAYWIIPFDDGADTYVVIERGLVFDNDNMAKDTYKMVYKSCDAEDVIYSGSKDFIVSKYKEVVDNSSANPVISWGEFNKFYKIEVRSISTFDLEMQPNKKEFAYNFVESTENTSFKIFDRETGETVEDLDPIYDSEERIWEVQCLFSVINGDAMLKAKEKIFKRYLMENC